MKLVIDIPEERYKDIQRIAEVQIERNHFQTAEQIISNGTPLPKGHGRLIDTNEITSFMELECNGHNVESLDEFTTIIEADKAESEEV